jgi:hypothetical protein
MHICYIDCTGIIHSTGFDFVDDFPSFALSLDILVRLANLQHKRHASSTPGDVYTRLSMEDTYTTPLLPMTTPFGTIECDATVDLIVDQELRLEMACKLEKVICLFSNAPKDRINVISWHPRLYKLMAEHLVRRHLPVFISPPDLAKTQDILDNSRTVDGGRVRKHLRIRTFHEFGDFGGIPQLTSLDYMLAFMGAI